MNTRTRLIRQLADGRFHSGTALGARLGVTRAAIAKAVGRLARLGLEVHAVPGKGYRLIRPIEPLDVRRLRTRLRADGIDLGDRLTLLCEVDSTNAYLLRSLEQEPVSGRVCLAEAQSQGRGRRGRAWQASAFQNLLLSASWRMPGGPGLVAGLSLASGVAVMRALRAYGVGGAGLKWPNDVLWGNRKLAGLLIDVRGEATGPCWAVLGVGINGCLSEQAAEAIDQPWVDLQTITQAPVRRNELAALVIREFFAMFKRFARDGFAPFKKDWETSHLYHDRPVCVVGETSELRGIVCGVNETGALRVVDNHGREHLVYSGEVSLRALS